MAERSVKTTVQMPPLHMRAAVEPTSLNAEKRTVDVVWTTGARVLRGYFDQYFEELSVSPASVRMQRLTSGAAPLLNAHQSYDLSDVIGIVESARLDGARGIATVRFAKGAAGDAFFEQVKDGILRNISVGYRVYKLEKVEDGIDTTPVYRVTDWEPFELSLVPVGADAAAVVRSEAAAPNPCTFIAHRQEKKMDPTADATKKKTEITVATVTPVLTETERAAIATAERERGQAIRRTARAHKLDEKFAEDHIDKGTSADEVRRLAEVEFEKRTHIALEAGGGPILIVAGATEGEKWMRCAEASIFLRAGVGDKVVEAAKRKGKTLDLDPGMCRGLRMIDLARACLERGGISWRGKDEMEVFGLALTQRGSGTATGMNATGDFTILLENTLHKTLLANYLTTPDTWRRFCAVGSVTDFRPHNRYRQGSLGVLDDVNEGGEFKNAGIPDGEKQSISAKTKGRIIALTRQALINDDMGAFNDIAARMGRASALTIEVLVYTTLLSNSGNGPTMGDGNPLFHSSHANINTSPGAISIAQIDADRVFMAQQQDPAKNEIIELRPAILLLPVGLGGQARVINTAQYDTDRVANGRNQEPNRVVGLFRDVVDTARLTGTVRYLFADPSVAPVLEVAFLNGQQEPFMEMQQGWRVDGAEWKVRLDVGCAGIDFRGVVRNAGA